MDIQEARVKNPAWATHGFFKAIAVLYQSELSVSFWEEEHWATILVDEEPVGYLWRKNPLAFILITYAPGLLKTLAEEEISIITTESLDSRVFAVDQRSLEEYVDERFDHSAFSAEELCRVSNHLK